MDKLTAIVGFIVVLSIASERLVEIVKGFIPQLDRQKDNPIGEGIRRSLIQILAVISGIVTAFLAKDYLPPEIAQPSNNFSIFGLGLLASGGSGFWNSILSYLGQVNDIKKIEIADARKDRDNNIA
jgi:hypothetical protein